MNISKVIIKTNQDPWKKWGIDLYRQGLEFGANVSLYSNMDVWAEQFPHDVYISEYNGKNLTEKGTGGINLVFVNCNEYDELKPLYKLDKHIFLCPTNTIFNELKRNGLKSVYKWLPPIKSEIKAIKKQENRNGFSIVFDASRDLDNIAEIVKTYFAMCLIESDDGELNCLQKLDIFSHEDLPFEVFNDITFHGLQPIPKMLKLISGTRAFISPYRGIGVPLINFDVERLGIPMILRDTESNREHFPHAIFFANETELAKAIKLCAETEVTKNNPWFTGINSWNSIQLIIAKENNK